MGKIARIISCIIVGLLAFSLAPLFLPGALVLLVIGPPIGTGLLVEIALRSCHGKLHLSTVIILSVLASAFMGLNLVQHSDMQRVVNRYPDPNNRDFIFPIKAYGWPFAFHKELASSDNEEIKIVLKDELAQSVLHRPPMIDIAFLVWDILLAVSVVALVALFCEWRIRKREARLNEKSAP